MGWLKRGKWHSLSEMDKIGDAKRSRGMGNKKYPFFLQIACNEKLMEAHPQQEPMGKGDGFKIHT